MKYKTSLLTVFVLFLFSCATKTKIVSEVKPEVISNEFVTESSESDIVKRGSLLYENNCGNCHSLPKTNEYTLEDWKPILDRMQKEAKISDQEKEDIFFYITRSI